MFQVATTFQMYSRIYEILNFFTYLGRKSLEISLVEEKMLTISENYFITSIVTIRVISPIIY